MTRIYALIICLAFASQAQAPKPAFEVASIKPNNSASEGGSAGPRGNSFFATNLTLKSLLNYAYGPPSGLLNDQIIGGPDWIRSDRFDVDAKADGDTRAMPTERLRLMVQSLLENRFQLKIHRETRDLPVYDLVVAKGGLKMPLSQDQSPPDPRQAFVTFDAATADPPPLPRGAMRIGADSSGTVLLANAVPISKLVNFMQGQADRILRNKTELQGLFDIQLHFIREGMSTASGSEAPAVPSLFTAIQELGLKLEPTKAPFEVVVIDSVQKLRPN